MNKAAFLDILHHVSDITDQEVSELEKLALNFPYCQSAHLLLAKAAYDRGSMLSNQKLRRAAACATNRQLLKKLIYTAGTDIVLAPIAAPEVQEEPETPAAVETEENVTAVSDAIHEQLVLDSAPEEEDNTSPETDNQTANEVKETTEEKEEVAEVEEPKEVNVAESASIPEAHINTEIPVEQETEQVAVSEALPELLPEFTEDYDSLFIVDHLNAAFPQSDPVTAFLTNEQKAAPIDETEELITLPTSDFEATATDITTEADIELAEELLSRHDPMDTENPEELILALSSKEQESNSEDETLNQFDTYLFKPEKEVVINLANTTSKSYEEEIIYKVFVANDLGYWMESSRLGETLLLKDELATAQPYHFSPELFLEYSHHHEMLTYEAPPTSILTRQIDIIDQFLKLNPKLKSMVHMKVKAEPQEDLSSRSTKIKKNLASENLANILIQQGKIKKAIKIYEHLILKIPEKKAYFASQIEKLHNLT